jgi:hypothetical protein
VYQARLSFLLAAITIAMQTMAMMSALLMLFVAAAATAAPQR